MIEQALEALQQDITLNVVMAAVCAAIAILAVAALITVLRRRSGPS